MKNFPHTAPVIKTQVSCSQSIFQVFLYNYLSWCALYIRITVSLCRVATISVCASLLPLSVLISYTCLSLKRYVLQIGTQTNLLVYDIKDTMLIWRCVSSTFIFLSPRRTQSHLYINVHGSTCTMYMCTVHVHVHVHCLCTCTCTCTRAG